MKRRYSKTISAVLAALVCASALPVSVFADGEVSSGYSGSENLTAEEKAAFYTEKAEYSDYYDEHVSDPYPKQTVPLTFSSADDLAEVTQGSYEGVDGCVIWQGQEGSVDFTCTVPESGNYSIRLKYYPIPGNLSTSEMSVLIDGASPYDAASRVELPHTYKAATEIQQDSKGNEQRPVQVEAPRWLSTPFKDPDGIFNEPLIFNLEAGEHTITFQSERAAVALADVELYNYEAPPAYTAPDSSELAATSGAANIKIQAENYLYTNSNEIIPDYDRGDYRTEDHNGEPGHPTKQRYNILGSTWNSSGQSVTWSVDVPQDGYYRFGVKGLQNTMRGMYSNRRLYVDGEVPNTAFEEIHFNFDNDWIMSTPTDENGDEAYLYLTAGTHELTLEANPGKIGEFMRRLDKIVLDVNDYYMRILMITGPTPDKYTDYYIHKEIPEIIDKFSRYSEELREIQSEIEALTDQKGSEAAALERLATVLDYCVKKPRRIQTQISNNALKDNVSSVSSWMKTYRQQPLAVDFIELAPADGELTSVKSDFGKSAAFSFKSFFGSFLEDYTVLSDAGAGAINVWSSLGRDQTNVIKQMVDSEFNTGDHSVEVAINLVQGGIMEAVLAGKGPDVSLFTGGEFPINLAIRGLLEPLNGMNGYDEMYSRFDETAFIPYSYEDQIYAIPLTRNFPMMFYRKDMLSEIGIYEYPETWTDLIDMLPAFQRNYMQPGLILPSVAAASLAGAGVSISPATEEGHTFAILMLQSGLNYYNEDASATTFDSQEAVDAFDMWTEFYTTYGFDQQYDAFSRFRTGEAPVVIQDYCAFYNQLNTAAPEIAGLWDFAPVPGTLREDGTVNHAANSNNAGAMILSSCKNKEGAWEFINWFSQTERMVEYCQNVEGVMGPLGRVAPADPKVLEKMNWSKSDLEKILAQMNELNEIPIIPSSYVVTRGVMNAFRSVVNDHDNARESLRWYNKDINAEITRKRKNLGIDTE